MKRPNPPIEITCPVCGGKRLVPPAWLRRLKRPATCSRHCSGVLNGREWAKYGHKGHAAWSKASIESHRIAVSGAKSGRWIGGRRLRGDGYIEILRKDHPRAKSTGYVLEHIVVAERLIGRALQPLEVIHHRDHNRQNNSPENLQVLPSQAEHMKLHRRVKPAAS